MCRIVIGVIVLLYNSIPGRCHPPLNLPEFLSSPSYIEGRVNQTILIPCVVHNVGKNAFRWWKDGTLISDTSDASLITPPRITHLTNNMLLIDWLKPGDAGNYTCQVFRGYSVTSYEQVHTVRVRHPPTITRIPENGHVEALLGSAVEMGCMASGWPEPVVTWKFKDKVMKSLDNRRKLMFTADDPHKSGIYECEASNRVGKPVTSRILLHILFPPNVQVEKNWVHTSPGMKTEVECTITGEPRPRIEWYFNRELLPLDPSRLKYHVNGDKHVLTIKNVQETDFGEYSCKAMNKVGEGEQTIELSGLAYPAVFKKNRGVVSPDSYSLIWEVDSYSPIIEYKLMFKEADDGDKKDWIQLIIPADANSPGPLHSKSYTLSGLKLFTMYQAQITSRNRFGWSEPSEIIKFGSDGVNELTEDMITTVTVRTTESEVTGRGLSNAPDVLFLVSLLAVPYALHTLPVNL